MRKKQILSCAAAVAVLAAGLFAAFYRAPGNVEERGGGIVTVWQIDSFEGGRGSRAQYLRSVGEELHESAGVYVEVTALSASAARDNIAAGNVPDAISYGAGFYGLEKTGGSGAVAWCRGGYCLISLGAAGEAPSAENTVINAGRDNLAAAAALFEGLDGSAVLPPGSACAALLNGEYMYLLGTQRDVIRLQTHGAQFAVQPVTGFNDLYQYISVLAAGEKREQCERFIELLVAREDIDRIGMLRDGLSLYAGEMHALEGVKADYTVPATVGGEYMERIKSAVADGDINLLKSLLKPL